ncbi:hypothetical protein ACHAW6_014001 [Cyclotella cf. meneghiniana]
MTYELVPPECHHHNVAKVAIQNFTSHFLSILAGMLGQAPLSSRITMNLLQQSNANPTVSSYAHLNGPIDYNKMPLTPLGCKPQLPKNPKSCSTWTIHSVDIGTLVHLLSIIAPTNVT